MRLFSRSLCGEALEWFTSHETRQWPSWSALAKDFIDRFAYNVEIVLDGSSLEKMKQKIDGKLSEIFLQMEKRGSEGEASDDRKRDCGGVRAGAGARVL